MILAYFEQGEKQGSPEQSEGGSYFEQGEKQGSPEQSEGGSYNILIWFHCRKENNFS